MITTEIITPEQVLLAKKAISIIRLSLGDGPLLQTKTITSPTILWNELKILYKPKGFSSEFLICRELFSTHLAHIPNKDMESYLNKITRLVNDLKARDIAIPNQVIGALILSNLTKEYDYIVAIITASLRQQTNIDISQIYTQLIDESRRLKSTKGSLELDSPSGITSNKPRDNGDIEMALNTRTTSLCSYCHRNGHKKEKCWRKYPNLRPEWLSNQDISNNTISIL